jgi:hypothetical protein
MAGAVRNVPDRKGLAWQGNAGKARLGREERVLVRQGKAWQVWLVKACSGTAS